MAGDGSQLTGGDGLHFKGPGKSWVHLDFFKIAGAALRAHDPWRQSFD